jgi:hypothetical protein
MMRAPGQHLGHHVPEPREHVVAGGVQHDPVEGDVVDEVPLQPVPARVGHHAERALGELGTLLGGGVLGGQARRDGLHRAPQHGQRAQLPGPVGTGQPPPDDLRIVDVPLVRGTHRHADPAPGLHEVHRFEDPYGLPHDGP